MRKLKQIIENVGADRQITPELKVEKGVAYLEDKYKYENGNWHMWCDIRWVNLQGGVPDYETNAEDEILEEVFVEPVEEDEILENVAEIVDNNE